MPVWVRTRYTVRRGARFQVLYRYGGAGSKHEPAKSAGTFSTRADAEKVSDLVAARIACGEAVRAVDGQREQEVYFARLGDLVKIGISVDPRQRASDLNAELVRVERGGRRRERELHRQFVDLRVVGEWFRDGDEIRAYLEAR